MGVVQDGNVSTEIWSEVLSADLGDVVMDRAADVVVVGRRDRGLRDGLLPRPPGRAP